MKPTNTCSGCKKENFGIWTLVRIENSTKKLCKACAEEATKNPADNVKRFEITQKRIARERKTNNDKIIKALKNNTWKQGRH